MFTEEMPPFEMEIIMATNIVDVEWKQGLTFDAHQQDRTYTIVSSVPGDGQPEGISPKQMLLTALAGCTGMDVASLLPKLRVPFTSLLVRVTGELTSDHPKVYSTMHVVYEIGTTEEFRSQVEKAVDMSTTKYCGVSAMLEKASTITHEIVLLG